MGGALCYVFAVGFKHSYYLISGPMGRDTHPGNLEPALHRFMGGFAWAARFPLKKLLSKFYAKGDEARKRCDEVLVPLGSTVLVTL